MSGRGRRFNNNRRGGGHRQGVKTTFGGKFNYKGQNRDKDGEDTPMQQQQHTHRVVISGYSHGANTEVLRTHLIGKTDAAFLEFNVQDTRIMAVVASKAEALSLQNISGTMFGNRKV